MIMKMFDKSDLFYILLLDYMQDISIPLSEVQKLFTLFPSPEALCKLFELHGTRLRRYLYYCLYLITLTSTPRMLYKIFLVQLIF